MEQLNIKDILSYYDYWLLKEVWTLDEAIGMLVRHHVFTRKWCECDDFNTVASTYYNHVLSVINTYLPHNILEKEIPDHIGSGSNIIVVYDRYNSNIKPMAFIKWAYSLKLDIPREFIEHIGELKHIRLTYDYVDMMRCQSIAKTLWDINPKMTTEDIMWHDAIQRHADGKTKADSTLRKWISAVDPRPSDNKPGPNKKGP